MADRAMIQGRHAMLSPSSLLARTDSLLSTEVGSEVVLMSIERGNYYGLQASARAIWEALATPQTFAALVAQLTQQFNGDAQEIEADAREFLARLQHEGLITVT